MSEVPYTPQELIVKEQLKNTGASFCMFRNYILIWHKDYVFSRHIPDMNYFLGG